MERERCGARGVTAALDKSRRQGVDLHPMRRLTAALALGLVAAGVARPAVLERVEVVEDGAPVVRLHVSEPVKTVAHALAAGANLPDRIYLDLPVTSTGPAASGVIRGVGPLLRVRTARFDADTVRVVLDLAAPLPFTVESDERAVSIRLGPPPAEAKAPASARTRTRAPTGPALPSPAQTMPPAPPVAATTREAPAAPAAAPPPVQTAQPAEKAEPAEAAAPAKEQPTVATEAPVEPSAAAPEPRADARVPESEPLTAAAQEPRSVPETSARPTDRTPITPPPGQLPARPDDRPAAKVLPVVIIDPGHGGHDPGAAGVGGIIEKDVVLDVARRLAVKLATRLPVSVVLTRLDDSFVPIERRVPEAADAALFLSLHANACHDASARGVEVFYGGGAGWRAGDPFATDRAMRLGRAVESALATVVGGVRGDARPGTFAVLARNAVPGVLVEIGYLTHPGDAARACDGAYQDLLTDALVEGVRDFLRVSAPLL